VFCVSPRTGFEDASIETIKLMELNASKKMQEKTGSVFGSIKKWRAIQKARK